MSKGQKQVYKFVSSLVCKSINKSENEIDAGFATVNGIFRSTFQPSLLARQFLVLSSVFSSSHSCEEIIDSFSIELIKFLDNVMRGLLTI